MIIENNENKNIKIRVIIFDLGGVIIELDFSNFYNRIISTSPLENPHSRQTNVMLEFFRQSDLYHQGKMSDEDFYNLSCDVLKIDKYVLNKREFFEAFNSIIAYPIVETTEILKKLKAQNKFKIMALSNVNSSHWKYLKAKNWNFFKYIDEFILSHEVHFTKPDPRIFQIAIQKSGCKPEEILFIDDGFNNIRSAKELGIKCIQYFNINDFIEELKNLNILSD